MPHCSRPPSQTELSICTELRCVYHNHAVSPLQKNAVMTGSAIRVSVKFLSSPEDKEEQEHGGTIHLDLGNLRSLKVLGIFQSPLVTNTGRSSERRWSSVIRGNLEGESPYLTTIILTNLVCKEYILTVVSLSILREQQRAPKHPKRARPDRRLCCGFQATRRTSLWRKGGGGAPRAGAAHIRTGPRGFGVINGTGMSYSRHPPRTYRSVFL